LPVFSTLLYRTNAIKLYHKVADGEEIRYFDVCSGKTPE